MPIYRFKCKECGSELEKTLPMSQCQNTPECEQCNNMMIRDYGAEHAHASADSYDKPLHSDSLAITPAQVEEHQSLFPDIEIDRQCRPVFHNFREHDKYLEATGFVKQTAKGKGPGKRIR